MVRMRMERLALWLALSMLAGGCGSAGQTGTVPSYSGLPGIHLAA